jgi:uncharacterized membrane protein (UPF0182 family)
VQAVNTPQPQFKRAIVVYGDKAIMRNSLKEALDVIFGAAPPTLEQVPTGAAPAPAPGAPTPAPGPAAAPNVKALLDRAAQAFADAQAALTRGDLAAYQTKVNEGAALVQQAQQAAAATPTTRPTTASA